MPSLGDFLGALLSDAARARMRADLEAVRIAALYAQDPLLKNLSVPRFRLPDVTVDVPFVVLELSGQGDSLTGLPFDEPTSAELREVVRVGLRAAAIRVPRPATSTVPTDFVDRARTFFQSGVPQLLNPASVSSEIADMLVDIVTNAIGSDISVEQIEKLRVASSGAMSTLLARKLRPSLSWQIAVTAAEISAQGDANNIVRLRLTISEDGYELITRDDGSGFTLTPE